MELSALAIAFVSVALLFDFLNGFHDSCNCVATVIASRSLSPRAALIMAAIADFCGPLIFGVAVAVTLGKGVVAPQAVDIWVAFAALCSAILWNLLTWYLAIPSSSSHALVGGLIGSASAAHGFDIIHLDGLAKVLIALFVAPLLAFMAGYIFMKAIFFLVRGASPKINWLFKRLQILASLILALSHSTNDAQKTMGIIAMGLVIIGYQAEFTVPGWVILACAGAIALGTLSGGLRLIKTVGTKMYRVRPIDAFSAQTCSALVILGAALLGGPVSSTQVASSALLGVGAAERVSKIRWKVAIDIATAWLLTIPVSAVAGAMLYWLFNGLF